MPRALFLIPALFILVGCVDEKRASTGAAAKKTYTREELKKAVAGLSKDEVKALLGPPYKTEEASWMYKGIATDPANGKTDDYTHIRFADGKATGTNP